MSLRPTTAAAGVQPHDERHFMASDTVRDIVIGMSDGLTVPFALAAGISGAIAQSHIIVTAGIAELAAGSIAMGLGGYLAARSEIDHFDSERRREIDEMERLPEQERREIMDFFAAYGLAGPLLQEVTTAITADKTRWVDFMMKFELGLAEPNRKAAPISALRIASSYIIGGMIPLLPYVLNTDISRALIISSAVTLTALACFGAIKGKFTGMSPSRSALQTVSIGGAAAAVAFLLARAIS